MRVSDTLTWANRPEDLAEYTDPDGEPLLPKSLTFIAARLQDNPKLMEADPAYRANLMVLNTVERKRLLKGNWRSGELLVSAIRHLASIDVRGRQRFYDDAVDRWGSLAARRARVRQAGVRKPLASDH